MKNKSMETVTALVESVKDSLAKYEEAKRKNDGYQPCAGYEVSREDCKQSIQRRISVIREELLKVSKSL